MLPDFLEIGEGGGDFPDHGAHSTQCCSFEGFASIQGICIFDQFQIISAHVLDHVFSGFDMTQG